MSEQKCPRSCNCNCCSRWESYGENLRSENGRLKLYEKETSFDDVRNKMVRIFDKSKMLEAENAALRKVLEVCREAIDKETDCEFHGEYILGGVKTGFPSHVKDDCSKCNLLKSIEQTLSKGETE